MISLNSRRTNTRGATEKFVARKIKAEMHQRGAGFWGKRWIEAVVAHSRLELAFNGNDEILTPALLFGPFCHRRPRIVLDNVTQQKMRAEIDPYLIAMEAIP